MKIITKIIFLIIIGFTINIIFYYISDDYRFFIKKVKNSDGIVYTDTKTINDEIKLEEEIAYKNEDNYEKKELNKKDIDDISPNTKDEKINYKEENNEDEVIIVKEVILGKNYKTILNAFSKYNLEELELPSNLFDLTDEYPDYYYEYYSKDLTLYFFTTKSYEEVKNIIEVVSYEVPYKINEINNFLDNSFYINLDEKISDNSIRLVILYKSITFGLKIKKDVYNDVKEKLKQIEKPTPIDENIPSNIDETKKDNN